jgi:hypothetical protein
VRVSDGGDVAAAREAEGEAVAREARVGGKAADGMAAAAMAAPKKLRMVGARGGAGATAMRVCESGGTAAARVREGGDSATRRWLRPAKRLAEASRAAGAAAPGRLAQRRRHQWRLRSWLHACHKAV